MHHRRHCIVGTMKEYRLASWPELRPPYQSTAHRRMVSGMSHRHMTLAQLDCPSTPGRDVAGEESDIAELSFDR